MRAIKDCNVCVVGGAGFLGSHCVNHLVNDRGCKVLVLDNLVVGKREFVHQNATFVHCDITHSEQYLTQLFRKYDIDFVFNYAAYPYIPDSFARPLHVCDVNFRGAVNVINAAHEHGACTLQISSAEIYGHAVRGLIEKTNPLAMSEDYPVNPHSTYGVSKVAVDGYVQVRYREAGVNAIALRQFNCVGERETHPYVVPEIIGQLNRSWDRTGQKGTAIVRLGNNSFRDFLYAGDQAVMAVELLEKGQFGEVYNLGAESGVKIYELAEIIGHVMKFSSVKVEPDESRKRPWEIWGLLSDNMKIHSVISSRPTVSLAEGLKRTVNWFSENGRKWPWEN